MLIVDPWHWLEYCGDDACGRTLLAQRRENQPAGNAEERGVAKSEFRLERTAGNRLCLSHPLPGCQFELDVNVIGLFKLADDGLTEESMRMHKTLSTLVLESMTFCKSVLISLSALS